MASTDSTVPEGLLSGPGPEVEVQRIEFANTELPEYKDCWAVVLDDVLTAEECDAFVKAAEATSDGKWERAMVNVGGGRQEMINDIRNCGRIIWDSREMVARLWARCEKHVPEIQRLEAWPGITGIGPTKRKEIWQLTRLNERMRFLKYTSGEYFKQHCDGVYETPDGTERSYFTLHLYLNDETSDHSDPLQGGATTFHSENWDDRILDVKPKIGRVLLFQHKRLIHSGADVSGGTKLTLRTDIMYKLSDEVSEIESVEKPVKKQSWWSSKMRS